jgi:amidase
VTALSPNDPLGAFLPGAAPKRQGAEGGPLSGITFAAKDIYDIAGTVTGCGNPDWARTHGPAERDAWAVAALLSAGAELAGKTISDELAYSLNGQNAHYGTPTNVNAPGRIPGGSSSGSAAAVAGGLVDTALGSDTGGSIRIPASYCGLFGLRPTHGRLSLDGVMPLAPSFDTVGWFAREAELLARVGEVLLGESPRAAAPPSALHIAEDAFALMAPDAAGELAPRVRELEARLGGARRVSVAEPEGFEAIMRAFRLIQAREIQAQHRAWIEATKPRFGPEVAERFTWALSVSEAEAAPCHDLRDAVTRRLSDLLGADGVLCLPTASGIAPRLDASAAELVDHRTRVLGMTALAGLSGLPQVTLPLAQYQGCPLGLSLIGPRGGDAMLLSLAVSLAR